MLFRSVLLVDSDLDLAIHTTLLDRLYDLVVIHYPDGENRVGIQVVGRDHVDDLLLFLCLPTQVMLLVDAGCEEDALFNRHLDRKSVV